VIILVIDGNQHPYPIILFEKITRNIDQLHELVKAIHPANTADLAVYPATSPQSIQLTDRSSGLQPIRRAPDPASPSIEHMGVYHRHADIRVAQKFLDGPDVIAILK
jgi:hypothetical protein